MNMRARLLWALALTVLAAGCSQDVAVAKRKYFESGNDYFTQKKYAEATIQYSNAIHLDNQFGDARLKLADAYKALGNTRAAFPEYIRAADLLPDSDEAQLKAGNLLVNGGFFKEAKERARTVLRRSPNNVTALVLLGNALAGLRDLDEGIGVMARAIQVDPESAGVYANLGVFQLAHGEPELAEKAFTKAVTVAPTSVDAHVNLANYYRAVRKPDQAERTFKKALELEPRSIKVHDGLAALYMDEGKPALAEPHFKSLVEIANDERSRFALAAFYVSVNRFPEAFKTLEDLARDKKHFAAAKIRIAMLYFVVNNRTRAHQVIDEVLARDARNGQALTMKARLLLADGKTPEALEAVKQAIMVDPRLADAQLALARVQLALHDVEEARKAFNDTLKLDPNSLPAQLELSELHRNRNEIDTAIQFAENAIKTNPGNLAARLSLVRALMVRDEDHARAEQELKIVLTRHPDSPRAQSMLAQTLLRRNDLNAAQLAFEKQLKLDPQSVEAVTGLVAIDLTRKRLNEARGRVDSFLAKHPKSPSMLVLASRVYRELGQPAKSEAFLTEALTADPSNPATYALLAELYISQKRLDDAKKQFAQFVKLKPKSVAATTMMGLISYVQGNSDEAQQWWEKALQIDNYAAAAANNLAWLYAEGRGNLEVALQLAMIAKSKYPNLAEVNDTLGWVYYRKDLIGQSMLYLQQSLDLEPNNPVYHYHLGMALARKGDDAKARRTLQRALQLDPKFPEAAQARKTLASLVY
jgi:putative PEP-CTERM system TPR-repeat lipoprotein